MLYAFAMYYSSNLNPFCTLPSLGIMGKGGKGESKQKESGDGERRDYSEPFGAQDSSECLCSLCDGRTAAWLDGYGV